MGESSAKQQDEALNEALYRFAMRYYDDNSLKWDEHALPLITAAFAEVRREREASVRSALGKRFEALHLEPEYRSDPRAPWRLGWYATWPRRNGARGTARAKFIEELWELILIVEAPALAPEPPDQPGASGEGK